MAREEKQVRLKPVDDAAETRPPVIRLESKETLQRGKPIRLDLVEEEAKSNHRLDVPVHEDFEIRTHQPGIDALIENVAANADTMEQDWGSQAVSHRHIPWGWFALVGLLLVGSAMWSLKQIKEADTLADQIVLTTQSVLKTDAEEDLLAGHLIDRIEAATARFFRATTTSELARHARHPERVKPLMDHYYGEKPIPLNPILRTKLLQPLTLDNRANFWMQSVELQNNEKRNLIIEITDAGEPKIDWETLVCYQPMKWDHFASSRPAGVSLDFRVYIEPDNFFSHEFSDSDRWNCFRLTALDSDETLFGYAKVNDPASEDLLTLLNQSRGQRVSVIIRVNIPEGLQSRRGVVIEKLLSPRWIHLDPPDA
jgi:hypothetical protein